MDIQKEREAFEQHLTDTGLVEFAGYGFAVDECDEYLHEPTQVAWDSWLIGLNRTKAQAVPEKDAIIKKLSDQLYAQEMKTSDARVLCETACELLDDYSHQDAMVILNDLEQAMIEAQEPAPLKLGDLVEPIDHRYTLASGCERYPYAYVVNTNPFQLMSEEGDMYWSCTVEAGGYKLIKSNDQLPEAVSLRMIREGLLSPVETQEPTHD